MMTEREALRGTGSWSAGRRWGAALLLVLAVLGTILALSRPALLAGPARTLRTLVAGPETERQEQGDPQVLRLLDTMAHADVNAAVRARDALIERGEEVVRPVIGRLQHDDPRMRAAAALVLGEIADPRAMRPLCAVLSDPDETVRFRAVYALGRIGKPWAALSLAPLLLDPSPDIVKVVLRALEECHCKVRLRATGPGYAIRPQGETEWQVIAPASG
jgi:hypothetical protein